MWSSVPNADFYILEFNRSRNFLGSVQYRRIYTDTTVTLTLDNTVLNRSSSYYWRVRAVNSFNPNPTGEFSEPFRYRPGRTTATMDATLDAAISIVPNPTRLGHQLEVRAEGLPTAGQLNFDFTDATGRVVRTRQNVPTPGGSFSHSINTQGLPAGIYFLRLQLGNRFATRRVVLTQ